MGIAKVSPRASGDALHNALYGMDLVGTTSRTHCYADIRSYVVERGRGGGASNECEMG